MINSPFFVSNPMRTKCLCYKFACILYQKYFYRNNSPNSLNLGSDSVVCHPFAVFSASIATHYHSLECFSSGSYEEEIKQNQGIENLTFCKLLSQLPVFLFLDRVDLFLKKYVELFITKYKAKYYLLYFLLC